MCVQSIGRCGNTEPRRCVKNSLSGGQWQEMCVLGALGKIPGGLYLNQVLQGKRKRVSRLEMGLGEV